MSEAGKILNKFWGHTSFRPLQAEIIQKVVANEDVLALLPTGGGKSICFQVPALLKTGICIVVSPLIALMEDQVNALKQKGIKAMAITGGIPFLELDTLLDNCIYGNYKFLYLSPERLKQEIVQERIKQMNVNLVAVDEAHCISQWGHDFRPAYRNIQIMRELQPEVNFIALTASATKVVAKDIVAQLEFKNPVILQKSFARKNIAYLVKAVQDKNYYLEKLLKENDESAIVYVRTRKATVEVADFLISKGISATSFHGGITREEKSWRLSQWLSDKKRVMVATSAFGMGIDKPNVRTVIHLNLTESLESYFQEAGRAGRDGKDSKAIILTNESDLPQLKNQFLSSLPDVAFVRLVYRKLVTYFRLAYGEGEETVHNFNFSEFCQNYELNYLKAYNTLLLLDRTGVLQLSEEFQKRTSIHFLTSHHQLTYYLEENPHFEAVVKAVLRSYGGVFDDKVVVNLQLIATKAGTTQSETIRVLRILHKEGIANFEHDIHDASITFLVPREDDVTVNPLIPYIESQITTKKEKIASVLSYIDNSKICRSIQLLSYFGERKTVPCGICSVCKASNEVLTKKKANQIYQNIIKLIGNREFSSREITARLDFEESQVVQVLQLLLEKGILTTTAAKNFKIKNQ